MSFDRREFLKLAGGAALAAGPATAFAQEAAVPAPAHNSTAATGALNTNVETVSG